MKHGGSFITSMISHEHEGGRNVCHGKNGPPKLVPPRTNVLINKDPRNLFWTPTEKFGPPHTDDKT